MLQRSNKKMKLECQTLFSNKASIILELFVIAVVTTMNV